MADLLTNDKASATAIFTAVSKMLGSQFINWEPETIWLDLQQKFSVDLSNINRDKLMACITVLTTDYFYVDAAVFENVCMAFCHKWSSPEILQEATPAQMSWGVIEAEFLRKLYDQVPQEFDYEPRGYVATILAREGFVVAPDYLRFAQPELDKQISNKEIQREVLSRWEGLNRNRTPLDQQIFPETPVGVQLARLAAVKLYVNERTQQLIDEMHAV